MYLKFRFEGKCMEPEHGGLWKPIYHVSFSIPWYNSIEKYYSNIMKIYANTFANLK